MREVRSLTIMLLMADTARADIAIKGDRTYYRFATEASLEDGDIAGVPDVAHLADEVIAAAQAREGEAPLGEGMKVQIFVNNCAQAITTSEASLRRLVAVLEPVAVEFAFLRGFLA